MEPPPSDPPLTISQNGNNHHNANDSRPIQFARSIWQKAGIECSCGLAGRLPIVLPVCAGDRGVMSLCVFACYPCVCCPLSLSVTLSNGSTVKDSAGSSVLALHL